MQIENTLTSLPLSKRMEAKIAEIAAIADDIPGVIIIHNNLDLSVAYMSKKGTEFLSITLQELIALGPGYHQQFFNQEEAKEYIPKIVDLLKRNDNEEWLTFFQQVRSSPDRDWAWYLSSHRILMRDHDGTPVLNITVAVPLDATHHLTIKVDRLQKENEFLRQNFHIFGSLSQRERNVLRLIALGKSSGEIANELFISPTTVDTHRRNIRKKLNAENSFELTRYALAFDLI